MQVLILGASARAAAHSALRAGLTPIAGDLFADLDLAAAGAAHRVDGRSYPDGLEAVARRCGPCPWLYTGALENHPALVDRIAAARPLWGNDGEILRAVRDPIAVARALREAGLPFPDTRLTPPPQAAPGEWLVKPIASAAGHGIRPLDPKDIGDDEPVYYQERVDGSHLSALYLGFGRGSSASLVGVTEQWTGWPGPPFAYQGNVGPLALSEGLMTQVERLGVVLASAFGLKGLFGVDLVLRDAHAYPVEVNPRHTASVEPLELATGRALLAEHARACDPSAPVPIPAPRGGRPPAVGKVILHAPGPCRAPELDGWGRLVDDGLWEVPRIADIPAPGTTFRAGDPVLTLLATGADVEECRDRLGARLRRWRDRLQRAPWTIAPIEGRA
jgi:predicted ATP-grasp superfamily ATP-dependent carboligase